MKVLVTGGTGFVGNAVRKTLSTQNIQTTVISRLSIKLLPNEKNIIIDDIFDLDVIQWVNLIKEFDSIIHMAWYVNHQDYLTSKKNIKCLQGSLNLTQAISYYKNKLLIGTGTCFEYKMSSKILFPDSPENPSCLYAETKLAFKDITKQLLELGSNRFIWARIFFLFGENESPKRLYPMIMHALETDQVLELTSGKQIRDFLHIDKAAQIIVAQLFSKSNFEIVNVCSGQGQSVKEFAINLVNERSYLLKFGARKNNLVDPPIIVGHPKK